MDSILRILQLKIHEIKGSPKSQLLVLLPALTIKSKKVGSTRVTQFIAKLPGEDFGFSQIGIILRFHALFFKVGIVLFRGNIPFLALDFLGKLQRAVPDGIQFAVIQGRVALLRSLQEHLISLVAHTIFLQNPSGKSAHGVVTAAFQDGAAHRQLLFSLLHLGLKQVGLIQGFIDLQKSLMPDHIGCLELGAVEKPRSILCLLVEEGVLLLKGILYRRVHSRVIVFLAWKQNVVSGSCGLVPLGEHIVAARNDHMVDIGKFLFQVFRRLPVVWIIRLVVHILRNHIGFQEIFNASVVVFVPGKDLVELARRHESCRIGDDGSVRIQAVTGNASAV